MKAITVRQPWASLIAAGVKTIETRPRACSYRGRIAIHAAKERPGPTGRVIGDWQIDWGLDPVLTAETSGSPHMGDGCGYLAVHYAVGMEVGIPTCLPLPLGAVVASAVLTDCLPIVGYGIDLIEGLDTSRGCIAHPYGPDRGEIRLYTPSPSGAGQMVSDQTQQLPFGDFSPGRYALLLDDITPTTERCPWCEGDGAGADADPEGFRQMPCPVCRGSGYCDPVPVRGQQAAPWNWQP